MKAYYDWYDTMVDKPLIYLEPPHELRLIDYGKT